VRKIRLYDDPATATTEGIVQALKAGIDGDTGIVWSIKAWEWMQPVIPSFDGASYVGWLQDRPLAPVDYTSAALTPGGYHTFEHRWALGEAFDYQARLGRAKVAERIRTLATRLKEGLADLPKVRLVTPMSPALSAGIVCFDVVGMAAGDAVERLRSEHRIGASVTPYATARIAAGFRGRLRCRSHENDAARGAGLRPGRPGRLRPPRAPCLLPRRQRRRRTELPQQGR
jgi:hypothetical protein